MRTTEAQRRQNRYLFVRGDLVSPLTKVLVPIIDEEREVFHAVYPQATVNPIYTTEGEGITLLLKDSVSLVITSRDFKKKEYQSLYDKQFRPQTIKLAYDGLALIVNKNNVDTCISVKDIARVLRGEAKNWSDIFPGSKRGTITVVFDNKRSSTVHFAEDSILGGNPSPTPMSLQRTKRPTWWTMLRRPRMPSALSAATGSTTNETAPISLQ